MVKTSEVLMLKSLSCGYSGPMAWWESYGHHISTNQGKVYFSASSSKKDKDNVWDFSHMEVPYSVLEDLSEMARAGGAVGSSEWVDPRSRMLDAGTHHYDLYWADGTHTGPGTATKQIMSYLWALARKYAEIAIPDEPSPKNNVEETAQLPVQQPPAKPAEEMWICSSCGSSVSSKRFCAECGAPKTD